MSYQGDFVIGATVDLRFSSRQFSTGAPFTLAGSPALAAYPDNSVTQLTAGITLTTNFDSITGLNHVRVVASTGNGYAAGSSYDLVLTAGTVDGVSVVGEVIGSFSVEARYSGAGGGLDAAGVRAAVGLASANLDTQLGAIDDAVDIEVAAVLAAVDTEVASIKTQTDQLVFTVANQLDANALSGGWLDAPGVRGAVGLATANTDAQLAAVQAALDALANLPAVRPRPEPRRPVLAPQEG